MADVVDAVPQRRRIAQTLRQILADLADLSHAINMFVVTEEDATAIREVFDRDGELSAAVELRRRFPLTDDNVVARQWARTIVGWKPLPVMPKSVPKRRTVKSR